MKKYLSRKFIVGLSGLAIGAFALFGVDNQDAVADAITKSAGALVAVLAALGYLSAEASVDAAAVKREGDDDAKS